MTATIAEPINLSDLTIFPDVAYALKDNAAIGLYVRYNSSFHENFDNGTLENERDLNSLSISPYYEHYFPLGGNWFFTLRGYGSIGWSTNESSDYFTDGSFDDERVTKSRSLGVGVSPGLKYMVKDWLMIQGSIGGIFTSKNKLRQTYVDSNQNKSRDVQSNTHLTATADFSTIGVIFILPNKD
ncbi:MAG: hypothetical protein RIF46_10950 [Cyclobacteriaceae bacterium]